MTFKNMAYAMTLGCFVLGLRFIFAGASLLKDWGIDPTDGPVVMSRRIGALYLGFALMFFLGRAAPASELRSAVCLGIGTASALLACLGFFERQAGRVSNGIIVPSVIEVVLAAAFFWVGLRGR